MDTPTIAAYYREGDAMKRKALLEQSIAAGEEPEANSIRKELWEIRYSEAVDQNSRADGYLKLWMAMEFNRDAGRRWFGQRSARKEIMKNLDLLKFQEIQEKSELHKELLYRECWHLVNLYMNLCVHDKTYNSMICGIMTMNSDSSKAKLQRDIYETAIVLPRELKMEAELGLIMEAAREAYKDHFPDEGMAD